MNKFSFKNNDCDKNKMPDFKLVITIEIHLSEMVAV